MAPTPGTEVLSLDDRISGLQTIMRWHPDDDTRTEAGARLVKEYRRNGRYAALQEMARAANTYPEPLKAEAREALVKTAWRAVDKKRAAELEGIVRDKNLSNEVRIKAGDALCAQYTEHDGEDAARSYSNEKNLKGLVSDRQVIYSARINAGMTLARGYGAHGLYAELIVLKQDRKTPARVKQCIDEHMAAAVEKYITDCVEQGDPKALHEMATDRGLAPAYRAKARENIPMALEKNLADKDNHFYVVLNELAYERWLPAELHAKVRTAVIAAAEKELRKPMCRLDWYEMEEMAKDQHLPRKLRERAMRAYITTMRLKPGNSFYSMQYGILRDREGKTPNKDFPSWLQAHGIGYLMSHASKWRDKKPGDFLWIARAETLPESLRLRAAKRACDMYAEKKEYAKIEQFFGNGKDVIDIPPVAQEYAQRYLQRHAVAEAERVMTRR